MLGRRTGHGDKFFLEEFPAAALLIGQSVDLRPGGRGDGLHHELPI
jgi:hypothetical protein